MKKSFLFVISSFLIILNLSAQTSASSDSSMSLIPGGEFMMGKGNHSGPDFSPAHKVVLDSFYIDKYQVTNRDYMKYCEATGTNYPEFWNTEIFRSGKSFLDYPVVGINWIDAIKYAEWTGKRLPTEAEWEYAARGGLIENEYPNGNQWQYEKAKQNSSGWQNLIFPVGTREPNGYGLYDMADNVWEWVMDGYDESYYQTSPVNNPKGPDKKLNKVIRGGSWHSGAMCKRVYFRKGIPANWCDFSIGFRCAKSIK